MAINRVLRIALVVDASIRHIQYNSIKGEPSYIIPPNFKEDNASTG